VEEDNNSRFSYSTTKPDGAGSCIVDGSFEDATPP
jgi:hypothetical protein